jgi:hypothetical protein
MERAGYYSYLPLSERWREISFLLRANRQSLERESLAPIFREIDEYRELLRRYCGLELENAKTFEIGYGRRPDRLVALMSHDIDASGIDLLLPLLALTPCSLIEATRINGLKSTIRSAGRYLLFDIRRRRKFAEELLRRGHKLQIRREGFLVGDVVKLDFRPHQFDLILSENVFEHIPERDLRIILPKLSRWLKPMGICLIRPDIFTGVWGGHLCSRSYSGDGKDRIAEPWEHLRKNRFRPTVYLNRLARRQYRKLFAEYFDIVEEKGMDPDMTRTLLTPEIARELLDYPEEELLSGQIMFVLRPQRGIVRQQ